MLTFQGIQVHVKWCESMVALFALESSFNLEIRSGSDRVDSVFSSVGPLIPRGRSEPDAR